MRQWRVGTFTMGLLLIAVGAGLLLDRFHHLAVVDFSLKWWPLIFIFLGLEVLLQNQIKKDENSKIKYDIFSIVIILLIVLCGLGLQTFSQIGLVEQARTSILAKTFAFEDTAEIPLEAAIQKIVLTTGGNPVVIHTTQGNSVIANSSLQVRAESEPEAAATAAQAESLSSQQIANVEYITLQNSWGMDHVVNSRYTLIVPEQVAIEINGADSTLDINLASVQNDWEIKSSGACTIKLPTASDLTINTWLDGNSTIYGNLDWIKSNPDDANQPENADDRLIQNQIPAKSVLGKGTHKMNILNMNNLTINSMP